MRQVGLRGALFAVLVAVAGTSCGGGGSNNDQGIVFRAIGMFRGLESIELGRITCTEPTVQDAIVDTAFNISLSTNIAFPDRMDPFGDPCGGYIGLENNLLQQAINVTEIAIRYEIPGAAVAVPSNSVTFGQRILPFSSNASTTSGQANIIFAQLVGQLLPAEIIVFLNQNVNRLPATPYFMNAFLVARGQSDQGTNYETNEVGYQFTIEP